MGAGDLIDVHDINLTSTDGEKVVATLRQNPAGSVGGARMTKLTFKSKISEAGFERTYRKDWKKRTVKQARLKVAGETWIVTGRFTEPSIVSNVDSEIEFQISIIGRDD